MSESSFDRDPFEVIAELFLTRFRAGERPGIEEYATLHPELADQIRALLPALVMVEQDLTIDPNPDDARLKAPDTPRSLGDFRVLREIGRGGMGVVYEAEQISLGRRVALKVLPAHLMGDHQSQERFRREAKSAARLHHTNIVPIFEVGRDGDVSFYAMQLIEGQGLDQVFEELARLRESAGLVQRRPDGPEEPSTGVPADTSTQKKTLALGQITATLLGGKLATERPGKATSGLSTAVVDGEPIPAATTDISGSAVLPDGKHVSEVETSGRRLPFFRNMAQIGYQAAQGLAHAHARGVIHRDIKPSNLLLDMAGVVWITDFGLAKADDDGMTATGDILGTLRYMAPERFRGEADARADIYALGLTLYELLTLRPAFKSSDRLRLIESIENIEPARPRLVDERIPRDLETIVLKSIDKDPGRRYATAGAMSEDLRRFLADEPIRARQIGASERYWRWARRNPTIATLGAVLTTMLVVVTIGSLLAAGRFANLAERQGLSVIAERTAHQEADHARKAAETARATAQAEARRATLNEGKAVSERRRADALVADMFTSRGLLAGERDSAAEALLWFTSAAQQAATAEDDRRRADNRLRARNWMHQAILPSASIALPKPAIQLNFQPRGDLLLTRFGENRVSVWSGRDGRRLAWAEELTGVASAQFSPDGSSVALGFLSGLVQIRKVADGGLAAQVRHQGSITALAFSPDGRRLAIASTSVRTWDIERRSYLDPTWGHPAIVRAVAFDRKGERLITACDDQRARVFALAGGPARSGLQFAPMAHNAPSSPALVDDDRILVTVTGDAELTRWSMATGRPASPPLRTRARSLRGVVASPDGRWFASGGYYGPEIFPANGNQPPVHLDHTNLVTQYAFSPDGLVLLSVGIDQTARLWSIRESRPLVLPIKHMTNINNCNWSDDSMSFATAQNDGLIRVWRRPADDLVIERVANWGARPRLSPDGRLAVPGFWHGSATGAHDQGVDRLQVVSTETGRPSSGVIALPGVLVDSCVGSDNRAVGAVWSQGGQGRLGVWDLATSRARFDPIKLPGLPLSVAARPGSRQLAVICSTGDLLVIDDRTGNRMLERRHEGWGAAENSVRVEYTPDGGALVSLSGGYPASVNVRDADSGRLRFAPLRSGVDKSNFHGFALAPDGRSLATIALIKNAVQVWDLSTGRPLSAPLPHPGDYWGLFSVRFSPDGRLLVTAHKDGQARCWDWRAGRLACPPLSHDSEVHDAAITPDGRFAITIATGRAEMSIWELATGRRIAPTVRLGLWRGSWIDALAITPDGRRALASSAHCNLAVVDLDRLLSPPTTETADLGLLAELATDRRIEMGDLSGLTTEQWQERWDLLLQRNPGLARSPESEDRRTATATRRAMDDVLDFIQSGIEAHRLGRYEVAIADQQLANQQLRALRQSRPGDPLQAHLHGLCLSYLAISMRELKRPDEASMRAREALVVYESIEDPIPGDLFNMACDCILIATIDDRASAADREKFLARAVGHLRDAIEADREVVRRLVATDPDIAPLRDRADFRDLMADAIFPTDPFTPNSGERPATGAPGRN